MNDLKVLSRILSVALAVTFLFAFGGAFIPGTAGQWSGTACIAVLIAAPVLRVAWLVVDWTRIGDLRFSLLGSTLLMILAFSGVIAFVR